VQSGGGEVLGLRLTRHARRRMALRRISPTHVLQVIALCLQPVDQGDGTFLFRAFVDNRDLGVVRAIDGVIVTVLDFSEPG